MIMNRQNSRHIIIMQHQFALIYANEVHEYITRAHEYITVCRDANGYAKVVETDTIFKLGSERRDDDDGDAVACVETRLYL